MKYNIYMCIQNIDDYYNTIYEKNIEVKNKKDMEEEINKLKENTNNIVKNKRKSPKKG